MEDKAKDIKHAVHSLLSAAVCTAKNMENITFQIVFIQWMYTYAPCFQPSETNG